jgi:hypothetical protein
MASNNILTFRHDVNGIRYALTGGKGIMPLNLLPASIEASKLRQLEWERILKSADQKSEPDKASA